MIIELFSGVRSNCGVITQQFMEGHIDDVSSSSPPDITHGNITHFHRTMCQWAYNISMEFQWVMVIDAINPQYLLGQIKSALTSLEPPGWDVSNIASDVWKDSVQRTVGCLFAQTMSLPGENTKIERIGITEGSNRGFLNAPIINGRMEYENLSASFLETNQSFVDGFLRPWSIIVSHRGLIAQPQNQSIKANIHVYQLAKNTTGDTDTIQPNIIRKAWTFRDAAPVFVSTEQISYDKSGYGKRDAQFVYNSYSINQTQ